LDTAWEKIGVQGVGQKYIGGGKTQKRVWPDTSVLLIASVNGS
jgi:hypothetical protein